MYKVQEGEAKKVGIRKKKNTNMCKENYTETEERNGKDWCYKSRAVLQEMWEYLIVGLQTEAMSLLKFSTCDVNYQTSRSCRWRSKRVVYAQ